MSARPALLAGSRYLGELSGQLVSGEIALAPRDPTGLASYASEVSNPSSSLYHHYLPAGAFSSLFGPAPSTVREARAVLRSAGLRVGAVSGNGLLVSFTGPAARVAAAFHTQLGRYEVASGRRAVANDSPLRLPAALAPFVQAVIGLDTLTAPGSALELHTDSAKRATDMKKAKVGAASPTGQVCRAAESAANNNSGLTDAQIASAYGLDGLYATGDTGVGQTIAIYELEPFRTKDISAFDTCYFGATAAARMLARLHTVAVQGGDPTGPGSGESELDIEDISALAPGATLEVYEAPNNNDGYLANFNQIIQDDSAKLVTSSWFSGCETAVATEEPGLEQVENTLFEQAAAQGQTVLEAAGDAGSDGCAHNSDAPAHPLLSLSDPASQPYVLAVGGTTINDATQPPNEQAWNDGASGGGGGGGISAMWPAPAWQAASKVPGIDDTSVLTRAEHVSGGDFCQSQPGLTTSTLCREVPDVSADADEYTGAVTVDLGGRWTTVGGTSSAAPLWAAMLAEIDATPSCVAHKGTGFVAPLLYQVASVPAEYAASFNDITVSNNDVFGGNDGLYPATKGYDMASGLGSPEVTGPKDARGLAYYLCASVASTRPVIRSVSPPVISNAIPESLTINGSGFESAGTPDVAGVTVGTYDARSAAIDVKSGTRLTVAV
ncbi:MAG: protease pro-enzyme activation domain-containing protein, partial [Solirubrobacteraceae bacterium]